MKQQSSKPSKKDFNDLAVELALPSHHLMIVSDGAGNFAYTPFGYYAGVLVDGDVHEITGGGSHGTNNYAELTPFLHAMSWYASTHDLPTIEKLNVACVSDSELTVKCAQGLYARNANRGLWAEYDHFKRLGFDFIWRHVPRNSNPINVRADEEAKRMRGLFK